MVNIYFYKKYDLFFHNTALSKLTFLQTIPNVTTPKKSDFEKLVENRGRNNGFQHLLFCPYCFSTFAKVEIVVLNTF